MTRARLNILVVDDEAVHRARVRQSLEEIGLSGHADLREADSEPAALQACEQRSPDLVFLDLCLEAGDCVGRGGLELLSMLRRQRPAPEVVVMSCLGEGDIFDQAAGRGAERYLVKPMTAEKARLVLDAFLRQRHLEVRACLSEAAPVMVGERVSGLLDDVQRVAPWDVPVLVLGPSGAGKELVAAEVHRRSGRKGAFVPVQLNAMPADAMAELFGWRRGAFTGATSDRKGLIEEAAGGTLFLDEIGELPLEVQAKLLRVIETKSIRPLGDNAQRLVDFRLVAATNRDLTALVQDGRFRLDLYHRLKGRTLTVPPLSQRLEDLDWLVPRILWQLEVRHAAQRRVFSVATAAMERLKAHTWPGNVRELLRVLENAMINACAEAREGGVVVLGEGHLQLEEPKALSSDVALAEGLWRRGTRAQNSERLEANQIRLLREEGLSNREIWTIMGIDRATFYRLASRREAPKP